MFYLIIIFIAMILIIGANLLFAATFTLDALLSTAISVTVATLSIFLIDAVTALIVRRLTPKKWYLPGRKLFTVSKKERNFYNKLKIKAWKDKVPELGGFTDFHKDRLESQSDAAYLERFLIESNFGVIVHLVNGIFGVFILFIPFCSMPSVWVPVFIVNLILSLMPVAILRHTSYTLLRLYNRSRKND